MSAARYVVKGATDAHVHVFDPRKFPFSEASDYKPQKVECGTTGDLIRLLDAHAIERAIVVNPSAGYGYDNSCLLESLAILGPRARGIAKVLPDAPTSALRRLMEQNVIGVRIDFLSPGNAVVDLNSLRGLLARMADLGMLLDIQARGSQWLDIAPVVRDLPLRVVIDHLGRPDVAAGVDATSFRAVLDLASTGRVAVKLSGADRYSIGGAPYVDTVPFIRSVVREYTSARLVWGSDWPFVRSDSRIDYGPLMKDLFELIPAEKDRYAILSDTPRRWFGFDV